MESRLFLLHALSAVQVGSGEGEGAIDQPVLRERATGLPVIPGTALKGILRDVTRPAASSSEDRQLWEIVFGPEHVARNVFQGALSVNDAFLLCLPVRSYFATFAWLTSPFLLRRYQRNAETAPAEDLDDCAHARITTTSKLDFENRIHVEDFDLEVTKDADYWAKHIAEDVFDQETDRNLFRERFAIVPDDVMAYCARYCLDVRARVRIDPETGTAAGNMLWYEEALSAETIVWGLMTMSSTRPASAMRKSAPELMEWLESRLGLAGGRGATLLQVGSGTTIGRGLTRLVVRQEHA